MEQEKFNISLKNLGTINKNKVTIGTLDLYFSYETIIAFSLNGSLKVCSNVWSKTTGKFLNELEPNKQNRLSYMVFMQELKAVLKEHRLLCIEC